MLVEDISFHLQVYDKLRMTKYHHYNKVFSHGPQTYYCDEHWFLARIQCCEKLTLLSAPSYNIINFSQYHIIIQYFE